MSNTPIGLYTKIKNKYNLPKVICNLHEACRKAYLCPNFSKKEVLDFDEIKTREDRKNKSSSHASVDAITYTDNDKYFCFVEIKGWLNFFKFQNPQNEEDIKKQVGKYELEKKLNDSVQIIKNIEGEEAFENVSICFIVATDVNIAKSPLTTLVINLDYLSMAASKWVEICDLVLGNNLNQIKSNDFTDIKKQLIHCEEFDFIMRTL